MAQLAEVQPIPTLQNGSGRRQLALKISITVTLTILLLGAGELGAYYYNRHRGSGSDKYGYRAFTVWRVVKPQDKNITLDQEGIRRTLYSDCGRNNYSIWMFGGSGLWGHFNPDRETIASLLAKRYQEAGRQVCVKNFGQRGWSSTQEVIALLLELKHAQKGPDLVIFYDGTVDSVLPYGSNELDVHLNFDATRRKFEADGVGSDAGFDYLRKSNTSLALDHVGARLGLRDPDIVRYVSPEQMDSMAQTTVNNYLKNMEAVDALAGHYGFRSLFFWEPFLLATQKPLTAQEEVLARGQRQHDPAEADVMKLTYEMFRALHQPRLYDLSDLFRDHAGTLFLDASHLNGEGNGLVAGRMYQILQQHPGT